MVKNTGDVTIPAGTWFAVNYPVNQIKHFQTSNDVPPGWATGINLQAAEGEDFVCGAWVWQDAPPPELAGGVVP